MSQYSEMTVPELLERIRGLKELRRLQGVGRNPGAAQVRGFVKVELSQLRAELRKRRGSEPQKSVRNLGWNRVEAKRER